MNLRVSEEILRDWREQMDAGIEPTSIVRLAPRQPVAQVLAALDAAVDEVVESAREDEGPWRGEWDWIEVGGDVIVTIGECEVLPEVLPALVAALEERGVGGTLEPHEPRYQEAEFPSPVRMLEARLRVRGRREHLGLRTYAWRADPDAVDVAIDAAMSWCTRGAGPRAWVTISGTGPVELAVDGLTRRLQAEKEMGTLQVKAGARGLVVDALRGRVALIETDPHWRRALVSLTDVLRQAAGALAYALVKNGSWPSLTTTDHSLRSDWPPRRELDAARSAAFAFEDQYAPDAFPLQLLGPGYAGRVPSHPMYRAQRAGAGCAILEHVDLPAWLDAPLVPAQADAFPVADADVPAPPFLAAAREALAPILFRPDLL
jgi:hypothetical protein